MPVKNGESDAEGDVSGAESERSNSSQAHDTSDEEEEANECDSDDSSEMDVSEIERRRAEHMEDLGKCALQNWRQTAIRIGILTHSPLFPLPPFYSLQPA